MILNGMEYIKKFKKENETVNSTYLYCHSMNELLIKIIIKLKAIYLANVSVIFSDLHKAVTSKQNLYFQE
jgi:hypothetical protein